MANLTDRQTHTHTPSPALKVLDAAQAFELSIHHDGHAWAERFTLLHTESRQIHLFVHMAALGKVSTDCFYLILAIPQHESLEKHLQSIRNLRAQDPLPKTFKWDSLWSTWKPFTCTASQWDRVRNNKLICCQIVRQTYISSISKLSFCQESTHCID